MPRQILAQRNQNKKLPSKVVLTKKPDFETEEDWKPKVRVTACGNFELEDIMTRFENRSEVPDAFMVRTVIAFISQTDWSIGAADLSTAFLNSELNDAEDGVYLILPPKFIINLGLEEEGILWKLDYALYGLKRAPKKWERTRDNWLKQLVIQLSDECALGYVQCENGKNVWKILRINPTTGESKLVGLMLLYVDDILIASSTEFIQLTLTVLEAQWAMTVTGTMSRDGVTPEKPVQEVTLLGCKIALKPDNAISFDQSHYIQEKLYERGYEGVHGSPNLPESLESQIEPVEKEDRMNPEFLEDRKNARRRLESSYGLPSERAQTLQQQFQW